MMINHGIRRIGARRFGMGLLLFGLVPLSGSGSAMVLAEQGRASAMIVVAEAATASDRQAAEELRLHIGQASGAELPIITESELDGSKPDLPAIYIGMTKAAINLGMVPGELEPDEYWLRTAEGNLFIIGEDGRGSLYGTYELLQRRFGVRWLWPGELGTYIPRAETLSLDPIDQRTAPGLQFRRIRWRRLQYPYQYNRDPFGVESRIGIGYSSMEAAMEYADQLSRYMNRHRQGSTSAKPVVGHRFSDWWRRYGQHYPEWFRLHQDGWRGDRSANARHVSMCISNPELHRYLVEEAWDGEEQVLSLGEVDRRIFCQCENCLAWDGPQPVEPPEFAASIYQPQVVSDRHARFWKTVYELAVKRNPEVTVSTFLYWNYMPAPLEVTDLGPGIYGEFVPWGAGRVTYYPMSREADAWLRQQWRGWAETGIRMAYRPNYLGDGYAMPKITTWQSGEFFRFAHANSMEGVDFDSLTGQWAAQGLPLYMHFRLIADPTLTVAEIREEYFSAFGPAAELVEQYFDYWEEHARRIMEEYPGSFSRFVFFAHEAYPSTAFEPAASLLSEALAKARQHEDPQYGRRVRFLALGLEHAWLCRNLTAAFNGERRIDNGQRLAQGIEAFKKLRDFRETHEHSFFADLDSISREESVRLSVGLLRQHHEPRHLVPLSEQTGRIREAVGFTIRHGGHFILYADAGESIKLQFSAMRLGGYDDQMSYAVSAPDGQMIAFGDLEPNQTELVEFTSGTTGIYRITAMSGLNRLRVATTSRMSLLAEGWVQLPGHEQDFFFYLPSGLSRFELGIRGRGNWSPARGILRDPSGQLVEEVDNIRDTPHTFQVDPEQEVAAGIWHLKVKPGTARGSAQDIFIRLGDNLTPLAAAVPEALLQVAE